MNERVVYTLSVTVRSPFMFQGLVNARLGVDAAQLRDERGWPIIPADQVRGVVRMALETLGGAPYWRDYETKEPRAGRAPSVVTESAIIRLFGEGSKSVEQEGQEHDRPERGRLNFADLVADREAQHGVATRIEIDDELGSVKAGALQVVELIVPIGTDVTFTGEVTLDADAELDAARVETALGKGLRLIPAIGAFKSAGFGEVVKTALSVKRRHPLPAPTTKAWSGSATRRAYRIVFDRPILVDAARVTGNLFVGCSIIPGAALKGALAERLRATGVDPEHDAPWAEALAALRVSHAFPENAAGVPYGFRVPNSVLCGFPNNARIFADALLMSSQSPRDGGKGFVLGGRESPTVALFPVDWKDEDFCKFGDCGRRFPAYEAISELPRMHVAIDPDMLVARDQFLFGTIARGVLRDPEKRVQRAWRAVVDAEKVAPDCREHLFALLSDGLEPVGRTGAFGRLADITAESAKDEFDALRRAALPELRHVSEHHPDLYAVTLLTPAMIIDPLSDEDELRQYSAFWASACGAELVASFTSRSLAGGYIATRRRVYGSTYYPFVLTDPGSVFLLRKPDTAKLEKRLRFGLDPVALSDGKGGSRRLDWRNCPYVPENGYGEIACHLVDHAALAREVTSV